MFCLKSLNLKVALPATLAATVLTVGCGDSDDNNSLVSFNLSKDVPAQTVEGQTTVCSLAEGASLPGGLLQTPVVKVAEESSFKDQKVSLDSLTSLKLTDLKLDLEPNSATKNFDWLKAVEVFIESASQDKVLVASNTDVAKGQSSLKLDPTDTQLAAYGKAPEGFKLSVQGTGCPPTTDAVVGGSMSFAVGVNPF